MNSNTTSTYIVESGNWKLRVIVEDYDGDEYSYLEAATRAIEGVFGSSPLGEKCEFVCLMDSKGQDYFDPDVSMEELPPPMFSVVTGVRKENEQSMRVYLTSLLFANAGQPVNFKLAMQAEALEPEKVQAFKDLAAKKTKKSKKKNG